MPLTTYKGFTIYDGDPAGNAGDALKSNFILDADKHETSEAHQASTSNPHSTTAAQVGAYTTAATDTLLAAKAGTSHTHAQSDVTNLVTDLAAKLVKASNLSDLTSASTARTNLGLGTAALNATGDFAAASHTHAQSDITNLVTDLAAKVPTSLTISTTAPLTGGGDLSTNRILAISAASGAAAGSQSAAHYTLLTNATTNATGNTLALRDGDGDSSFATVTAATLTSASNTSLTATAGPSGAEVAGGSVTITAADGGTTSGENNAGAGGSVSITAATGGAGDATYDGGSGGSVTITAGLAGTDNGGGTGSNGSINLKIGSTTIATLGLTGTTFSENGIGSTSTDALILSNTTAAAAGAQQWSPRLHWSGKGWKTASTAASQAVDVICELVPVQGTSAPTGNLVFSSSINAGAYSAVMTLSSAGSITIPGGQTIAGSGGSALTVSGGSHNLILASQSGTRMTLGFDTVTFASGVYARGTDGSATTPSYSFTSETGTGMYYGGSSQLAFASGGVGIFLAQKSGSVGWIKGFANGATEGFRVYTHQSTSSTAPIYTFNDDTDTGINKSAANTLNMITGGATRATFTSAGINVTGATNVATGTITASTPALDVTQTWNAIGTTFTGIKANITDSASASASLLMDLQVGSASKFSVTKGGAVTTAGEIGAYFTNPAVRVGASQATSGGIDWDTSGNALYLRTFANSHPVYIQGTAVTLSPTTGSTSLVGGTITTDVNFLSLTGTWNSGGTTFTALKANITDTASASTSLLIDLQVGGTSKFKVDKSGIVTTASSVVCGGSLSAANIHCAVCAATGAKILVTATFAAAGSILIRFRPNWVHTDGASHHFFRAENGGNIIHINKYTDNKIYAGMIMGADQRIQVTSGSYAFNNGQIHTIVYTWDDSANTQEIFVDGVSEGTSATAFTLTAPTAITIGNDIAGSENFDGRFYDFQMFDRVVTGTEITNYAAGISPATTSGNFRIAFDRGYIDPFNGRTIDKGTSSITP